jgi:hypothetical protein
MRNLLLCLPLLLSMPAFGAEAVTLNVATSSGISTPTASGDCSTDIVGSAPESVELSLTRDDMGQVYSEWSTPLSLNRAGRTLNIVLELVLWSSERSSTLYLDGFVKDAQGHLVAQGRVHFKEGENVPQLNLTGFFGASTCPDEASLTVDSN